jgi:hypothetical protein
VTLGSVLLGLAGDVAACETAVPPIRTMHEQAAARLDKDLMAMSSQCKCSELYPPPLN